MELQLTREAVRFERLVTSGEEQVAIEGEAALPGSMRDAVTVLGVQAQAHIQQAQAGSGEAAVRGRVCFQVLYTQGDLTRVRALETTCDFTHSLPMPGVTPGMRLCVQAGVQETEGTAGSGRMTLRALLGVTAEAFETVEKTLVTGAREDPELRTRMQTVTACASEELGADKTLVRDEFDLPAKLGVGDVLSATGVASVSDLTGGNGRVGVTGVIEVRVLHQPQEAGHPMVITAHELPFELSVPAQLAPDAQVRALAEVTDVMADSVVGDKHRTLRVEAEVTVRLTQCRKREMTLLEDLYSLSGPVLEPVTEAFDVHADEEHIQARESTRIQVTMPKDAPPIDTVLAAFVQPVLSGVSPAGRRLDAEGVMGVTLIYLPVDSDIPVSVRVREPFAMTFPVETEAGVTAQLDAIECTAGPATSDRAEVRCVLGLTAVRHGVTRVTGVTDVTEGEEQKQEHGFVLVWPAAGETRWDTARRLRVAQEALRPAGSGALLAFRK